MRFPLPIEKLIQLFKNLPTVGPKTAERYVFYLLKQPPEFLQELAKALVDLPQGKAACAICGNLSQASPCAICANHQRDHSVICLVATVRDLLTIEDTKKYTGVYHVLGGTINAINNVGLADLRVQELLARLSGNLPAQAGQVKEIILALDPNFEGETTALYLKKLLEPYKLKLTRLAKGLPTGASLEYADERTLADALKNRNEI